MSNQKNANEDKVLDQTDISSTRTVIRHQTSWRWVVVFGSFCAHFVGDGVLFSFGILMHVIKDDLRLELHTVGVIASLFVSLPLLLAPLSSALVNKFGCRFVCMLGGFLCSMGLLFASLLGNYFSAVTGIGITCGIGLSFIYVPSVVIVAHYFDEHRAIATAVAVGGTGLGNAVVAQLIHILNDYYSDWRDTTLLLSSIFFTVIGFGALFRPVEFSFERSIENDNFSLNDKRLPPSRMTSMEKLQRFVQDMDKQCATRQAQNSISIAHSNNEEKYIDLFDSYSTDDIEQLRDELLDEFDNETIGEKLRSCKFRHLLHNQTTNDKSANQSHSSQHGSSNFFSLSQDKQEKQLLGVYYQPISQIDIFYRGNVAPKVPDKARRSCPDLIQAYVYEEAIADLSEADTNLTVNENNNLHHTVLFYRKGLTFFHTLRRMLGLQLFADYRYCLFFISQFLFYLFYDLIYLFPVDYGETVIGYTKKQMTMLITILGFGQFFGQIIYGLLANYTKINELMLYNVGAVLCGISSVIIPYIAHSYVTLVLTILLFGLSISANYALTSIILTNMFGLELLTSAYGLILLGQGLSSLAGPVIGGWIAEKYGYKLSLIVAGIFMGVSGFVNLLIPIIKKLRQKKSNLSTEEVTRTNTTTIRSDSTVV